MTNLKDGLVLHLPFSEGSGSKVFDRSKYQNNGTITGATWVEPFESPTEGAWLKGWSKRIKITIDSDDVDSDLTDFPVYINVSTASGIGDVDISAIFDEVGANSLKIAVATFSGIECYVEVVSWDSVGEVAELWAKIPYISSSEDTIIYIYYDSTHADNTDFVGATNSAVAENVWDAYYKIVSHMEDDPDNSHIRDSTSNDFDGTKDGAGTPAEQAGNYEELTTTNGIITANSFSHIVVIRNISTGNIEFYINGKLTDVISFSITTGITNHNVKIGSNWDTALWFSGLIDEIRIYNRALTPEEVRLLYLRKVK